MIMLISMRRIVSAVLLVLVTTTLIAQSSDPVALANEYYRQGELEKAQEQYKKLARNKRNVVRIHDNYFKLLLTIQDFEGAEKYVKNVLKQFPENYLYEIDLGIVYQAQQKDEAADKYFDSIIRKVAKKARDKRKTNDIRVLAQTFFEKNLREKALLTYQKGREALNRPSLFSLELANAYRLMNKKQLMIKEYLTFSKSQPQNLNYVKNSFQRVLREPADLDTLEMILYDFIQEAEGEPIYNEMLIWTHLQQKNFAAALRQAYALDSRNKAQKSEEGQPQRKKRNDGENIINVGLIAYRNADYKTAEKAFNYIIRDYPDSPSSRLAQKYVLLSEEEVVKSSYPVDTAAVRELIAKYEAFKGQSRDLFTALDAQRRKALLHAFYLNEIPESIEILTDLVSQPVGKHRIIAESKMDLADIYLLDKQPWESILLYAQVERMFKDEPLGYEAKLKSAKLSYFKGEFELAQGHLDILKLATSREIANDALNLSILIKNNTVFDSTDLVMQEYANVELMLFQNQKQEALTALDEMVEKYAQHSIVDEVYFLKAKTYRELGEPGKAIEALNKINESFYFEILGDDALFLTAVIHEDDLKDAEKSMELYTELLNKYPGSIFVSEARKRFRELRGDF